MRQAVRAIIIKDNQFLVMHRNKFGRQYFTLVGGGVDFGETKEQSLIREVKEETTLEISNPRLVIIEETNEIFGTQYVYLCDYKSGEPKLAENSDEALISKKGKNLYIPMWLPIDELEELNLLSDNLKRTIVKCFKDGWPEEPVMLHATK